jgi:CDP-glycerol glycerophosphotransferase (TagB/SpsB family)
VIRQWFAQLVSVVWRSTVWVLLRLLPARAHCVIHGWPDAEGNAVEMVRALRRRYRGRIYWLLEDITYPGPGFAAAELADPRIIRLAKSSPTAVLAALTAELTVYTHGLFTAVRAPSNRLVVNLWHGDGPKALKEAALVRSHVLVSGSPFWSEYKRRSFRVPAAGLAMVGNPRVDQLFEPLPDPAAQLLGLTAGRVRVLWLPTFRDARGPRRAWSDGDRLADSAEVREVALALSQAAAEYGVELVVKPHPLDLDDYRRLGISVLRDDHLGAARVSLYQLIGSCDALISDISSVWVDFLALDRPVGFFMPDLPELERRGGLHHQGFVDVIPGLRVDTPDDARTFIKTVALESASLRPSFHPRFGQLAVPDLRVGTADRLVDWLANYQQARSRPQLFTDQA